MKINKQNNGLYKRYALVFLVVIVFVIITILFNVTSVTTSDYKESETETVSESVVYEDETKEEASSLEVPSEEETIPVIEQAYDYSKPVPLSDEVGDDYFDDAVFLGNTRTEGFIEKTNLTNAVSFASKGLMVNTVFTYKFVEKNGTQMSAIDALRLTNYSKIYIMLGINETGWPTDEFIQKYYELIDEIKKINPDAIIYVQEILPVAKWVSENHSYVNNGKIAEFNELIRKMAMDEEVYFIDVAAAVVNSDGCLPDDAEPDGIHLTKEYYQDWLYYLKTHTVKK